MTIPYTPFTEIVLDELYRQLGEAEKQLAAAMEWFDELDIADADIDLLNRAERAIRMHESNIADIQRHIEELEDALASREERSNRGWYQWSVL